MDAATRRLVRQRAQGRCEYCRLPQAAQPFVTFHVEHILPRSRGGQTVESNLALSCPNCNLHKSARLAAIDPETGAEVPLFSPRTDAWQEHFTLSADHAHIIGIIPIGRATVAALRFNNPEHVDARQLWVAGDWYPPPGVV